MAKLVDVARRAGVGYGTASRAISGRGSVDAATRQRVLTAAEELGYRPHGTARALREQRTNTVGLLLPDIVNDFYMSSAEVLQELLGQAGYQLIVAATQNDEDVERRAVEAMLDRRVDGLVLVPVAPQLVLPADLPVVELNRHGGATRAAVLSDDVTGVAELTRLVLDRGYDDILVVGGPSGFSSARERLDGFRRAVAETPRPVRTRVTEGAFTAVAARRALQDVLSDLPQVVLALSSRLVVGVLGAAKENGLRIPADVALAGYGDPEWFSVWEPAITTFAPALGEMGESAARVLLEQMAEGESGTGVHRVPGRLRVRDTVPPRTPD